MKKILALVMALSAISAYAGSPYVDANVGVMTNNSDLALNLDAGYMFNKYLGLEGGYTGSNNYSLFDGVAKGVLPLGIVDLYGKIGMGFSTWSGSSTNTGLLYGVGVAFPIAPMFQLHIEDYAISGNGNPNFLMFGGQFTF